MTVLRYLVAATCFAAVVGPTRADELPARKPGLWESTTSGMAGMPAAKIRQCIDAKTDQLAQAAVNPAANCAKRAITKTSAGYEIDSSCKIGAIQADGKGLISGDFTTKVKLEMTTTMSGVPGQAGPVAQKVVIENSRVGDCEAGQKPGDIIMPDGRVIKAPGT